jgi:hypothetical protein
MNKTLICKITQMKDTLIKSFKLHKIQSFRRQFCHIKFTIKPQICIGAVVVVWKLDLQLPVQSVPITTNVVSLNPIHGYDPLKRYVGYLFIFFSWHLYGWICTWLSLWRFNITCSLPLFPTGTWVVDLASLILPLDF